MNFPIPKSNTIPASQKSVIGEIRNWEPNDSWICAVDYRDQSICAYRLSLKIREEGDPVVIIEQFVGIRDSIEFTAKYSPNNLLEIYLHNNSSNDLTYCIYGKKEE
ncbi:hypothetical protein [Leptospira levettii]|uniref:hypothetical protein n=1 Tax=Leptospira levettii TaxID=2023178 RepID=UPI000C295DFC|nr:hypothetical protein [Leptospira levettii]PJZ87604.1 hypothetical protein CH368_15960 [Leptospira levettii]